MTGERSGVPKDGSGTTQDAAAPARLPRPDLFVWDNWVLFDPVVGLWRRFFLAAPREGYTPEERHDQARVWHESSSDGRQWRNPQKVLDVGSPGAPDDQAVWSGCALRRGGELHLFYTARGRGDHIPQTIKLARSPADGTPQFTKDPQPVLPPQTHPAYDTAEGDGILMAWRDPYVFRDPVSGDWYMAFAAKHAGGHPAGCVGLARASDEDYPHFQLVEPLALPREFTQVEVPSLIHRGGWYYCFINTADRVGGPEELAGRAVRGYRSRQLSGPWEPVTGDGLLFDASQSIYAVHVFSAGDDGFCATGFYTETHPQYPLQFTPLIDVDWKDDVPYFKLGY